MKRTHLLRVEHDSATFDELFAAARADELRGGWLELSSDTASPRPASPKPTSLARAAASGALRAVSVDGDGSVSVKHRAGPFRLEDLVREHFLGCSWVLVRGAIEAPLLVPKGDEGWLLRGSFGERRVDTRGLISRLRKVRPFEP